MYTFRGMAVAGLLVLASGAFPVHAASPDRYLPDNAGVLLTINLRRLVDSAPSKRDIDTLRDKLKSNHEIQEELDAIGFDPFKDLDSLAFVGNGSEGSDRFLVIAHGRFDFGKLIARAEKVRKEHSEILKVVQEKSCSFYAVTPPDRDQAVYIGWPDSKTIIASPARALMVHAFDIQNGQANPSLNKSIADLLTKVDKTDAISLIGLGTAFKNLPEGVQVRYITGSLRLGLDLHLAATVALMDAPAAEQFAKTVTERIRQAKSMMLMLSHRQKELAFLVPLLDALKVSCRGDTVRIQGDISQDALATPSQRRTGSTGWQALDRPRPPRSQRP
jgi:hypothetical protein